MTWPQILGCLDPLLRDGLAIPPLADPEEQLPEPRHVPGVDELAAAPHHQSSRRSQRNSSGPDHTHAWRGDNEYGYMTWFLNTARKPLPSVPESTVTFRGNGQNIIYVDWENDLVVVVRWIGGGGALNEFLGKIVNSVRPASTQP